MAGHEQFDELAAGHALHALEPADEQAFLGHLETCPQCRRTLADFSEVAAGMALTSDDDEQAELPPQIWQAIRAAIDEDSRAEPLPRRRRRFGPGLLAAAAAVVLLAAGLIGWQVAGSGSSPTTVQSALRDCRHTTGCHVVQLTNSSKTQSAYVLITGQNVRVATATLPAIDAAQETYVLWQMPQDGRPSGLVAFAVNGDRKATIARATLTSSYDDTTAFAISRESGTTIPPKPGPPVVIGAATA
jgi:ferric-dicitrate binding protein FerR (iron transport regulator)